MPDRPWTRATVALPPLGVPVEIKRRGSRKVRLVRRLAFNEFLEHWSSWEEEDSGLVDHAPHSSVKWRMADA